jgi:hypothetical protein
MSTSFTEVEFRICLRCERVNSRRQDISDRWGELVSWRYVGGFREYVCERQPLNELDITELAKGRLAGGR